MPLTTAEAQSDRPVLVTGATGFLGSHVVRRFASCGERIAVMMRGGFALTRHRPAGQTSVVEDVKCDLLDAREVSAVVQSLRPRACIHAAWDVERPDYLASPANQHWVQASLHLARCLMEAGCAWIGACGTHLEPDAGAAPPNRYAAAKATLRNRLVEMAGDRMTVCWWRIFQPFGAGERDGRFVPSLLQALATGERFVVRQPEALRDFIHADDVAAAIVASQQRGIGGTFELGNGRLHSIRHIARHMARAMTAEHLLDFAPATHDSDESRSRPADLAALAQLAQWRPNVDVESALRLLAAAHRTSLRATA